MDSPDPVILGIVAGSIVLLLIIIAMIVHKKKSVASNDSENQQSESKSIQESSNMLMDNQQIGMSIKFEEFSTLTEEEETHLVEIHDKKFLARIDNAIPGTLQAIANTGAIHNYNQAIRSAGQLYRAVIPQDAALVNSRSLEGAFRGFYRGKNNIRGQANLIPVDGNMGKGLATMGVVNTAMSIASMVVGQYYMSLISNKLDTISNSLKQIAEFQDNEYTGKVYTLIAEVQKCAIFKAEIIGNDELRNQELAHLKDLEHECAELLSQANITLQGFAKKVIQITLIMKKQ